MNTWINPTVESLAGTNNAAGIVLISVALAVAVGSQVIAAQAGRARLDARQRLWYALLIPLLLAYAFVILEQLWRLVV